jgi:hypothetical protein
VLGIRHTKEVEEDRQVVAIRLIEEQHATDDLFAHLPIAIAFVDVEVLAEGLQDRKQRDVLAVRDRTALERAMPPGTARLEKFERQPALADPGFSDNTNDLAITRVSLRERSFERTKIVVSPDEAREPSRLRDVEPRAHCANSLQLEDGHGLTDTLDVEFAKVAQLKIALHQIRDVRRQIAGIGRGQALHPSSQPHRVALRGVIHAQVVADLAHDDLTRVESNPNGEADSLLALELARVGAKLLTEPERRVARPLRVILVRNRRAKEGHDAVAEILVDRPLEAVHALRQDFEEAIENAVPFFGVELFGELHRAGDVREEHGDVLALSFERRARLQDPIRQVLRGVAACIPLRLRHRSRGPDWRRGLRGEGDATVTAESGGRAAVFAARGTRTLEPCAALLTEA